MRLIKIFIILLLLTGCEDKLNYSENSDFNTYPKGSTIDSVDVIEPDTLQLITKDSLELFADSFIKYYPVKYLVIHCTATPLNTTVQSILNYWKNNLHWKNVGYHFIIDEDGRIWILKPFPFHSRMTLNDVTNGVKGINKYAIHVSWIGGLEGDNRTEKQKESLKLLVETAKNAIPNIRVVGHRDVQIYTKKSCPNFDVLSEYNTYNTAEFKTDSTHIKLLERVNILYN